MLLAPPPQANHEKEKAAPFWVSHQSIHADQSSPHSIVALKPYGAAALDAELKMLRAAPVGQRNRTLNWVAFRAGQLARRGALTDRAQDYIADAARALLLPSSEIARTLRSGWTAGWRKG